MLVFRNTLSAVGDMRYPSVVSWDQIQSIYPAPAYVVPQRTVGTLHEDRLVTLLSIQGTMPIFNLTKCSCRSPIFGPQA